MSEPKKAFLRPRHSRFHVLHGPGYPAEQSEWGGYCLELRNPPSPLGMGSRSAGTIVETLSKKDLNRMENGR